MVLIGVIALLLLAYVVLRSVAVSFSWDESYTFINHVRKNIFYQQAYDKMGGNHHLLNVWGMWVSMKLFGNSELTLRLPNVLAFVIYLYASARIALQARTIFLSVAAFLLLTAHPYLLDFFSLARGYGLACGWMMLSLWQVCRYLKEGQQARRVGWATLCAVLSAMSHGIMIHYLLAFALTFTLWWLVQSRNTGGRKWLPHFGYLAGGCLLGLVVILPNALGLFHGGSLYFGCDTWECLLRTLAEKFVYHQHYDHTPLWIAHRLIVTVSLWCLITVIVALRKGWTNELYPFFFATLIFGGCLLSFFVQHVLFAVPFPQTRTGLFLIPLAAFILVAALNAWTTHRRVPILVAGLFCVPLIANQVRSLNMTYAVEWKPSGEIRHMLEIIEHDHLPLTPQRPIVTLSSGFESWGSTPYYTSTRNMQWLVSTKRIAPDAFVPSDYYFVEYDGYDRVDNANWTMLYRSETTGTSLYRDEQPRRHTPRTVYHALRDMEEENLKGGTRAKWTSGHQSVRFDAVTRSTDVLSWKVPEGWDGAPVELAGSGMVMQSDDTNWLSLVFTISRDGLEIAHMDAGSAPQIVHFGTWNKIGIRMRPTVPLQTGDEVQLSARPQSSLPPIWLDDLELWVIE
jgi:hypothetical protein